MPEHTGVSDTIGRTQTKHRTVTVYTANASRLNVITIGAFTATRSAPSTGVTLFSSSVISTPHFSHTLLLSGEATRDTKDTTQLAPSRSHIIGF